MNGRDTQPTESIDRNCFPEVQALLGSTGIGLWLYEGESGTLQMDDTCRRLFGFNSGERVTIDLLRSRIHPEDIEEYRHAIRKSLESGLFLVNYRTIRPDGSICHISGRGRTTTNTEDGSLLVNGICIDMTDRHRLEQRLRDTEDRMQQLADGIPGLFSYIDRDYRIRFMSSLYREIFQRSADELLGQHVKDIIGDELFAERKQRYDAALAGEVVRHESTRTMPDGQERYFTITHVPHRNARGDIQGILTLAIDITERRTIEQALEQKSDELARSNHDLEKFAYVASHDLKAPLRAIEVLVQWLREDLDGYNEGEVQENLGLLTQRTQRLNRLLDDLLEYSRAGRQIGELQQIDTRAMVDDIANLLAPPPGMRIEASPELPVFTAHAAPLEQVLRNLINNAIKHHPTQTGRVRVSAVDQGEQILFAVEDDGAGIPQEYSEKVFQMFQTLQPRDEREGSGMGLAIVKRIVDGQGGHIWFHPGPGNRGTVFKFTWSKQATDRHHVDTNRKGAEIDRTDTKACQHTAG